MQQSDSYNQKTFLTPSRKSLSTIYRSFFKSNLDFADMIYGKSFYQSFKEKIEMVEYKAALVIIGTIKGTSSDRLYQELGSGFLADRR